MDGGINRARKIVSILAEKPPMMLASDVKEKIRMNFLKWAALKLIFIPSLYNTTFKAEKL